MTPSRHHTTTIIYGFDTTLSTRAVLPPSSAGQLTGEIALKSGRNYPNDIADSERRQRRWLQEISHHRDAEQLRESVEPFPLPAEAGTAAVYRLAGEPLGDDARMAMSEYLAAHQRGRHGRVATSCEMFGLDEGDLRVRFAPYAKRFR